MNSYTCNWPVKLNGKLYKTGKPIPVTGELAEQLEASGAISAPAVMVVEKPARPKPVTAEQLEMIVAGAARQLSPETKGHFLKDGRPDVAALQGLLDAAGVDHQLTAAERDRIWTKIKPAPAAAETPVTEGEGSKSA